MKIHSREIFKRNFQFILFLGVSLFALITFIACLKAISTSKKPLIIAIDINGTRVVSDEVDPIYKTEAIGLIKKYLYNVYNFDSKTFMQRIGFATSQMSTELWEKKRLEILDLKNKIERDEISLIGEVQKLTVDENGKYHALVSITEKSRLNIVNHLIEVTMGLKKVSRTIDNPHGIEVDSYEESIVNR